MTSARCPGCGAEYQVGDQFCRVCGDYLEWTGSTSSSASRPRSEPAPAAATDPVHAPDPSRPPASENVSGDEPGTADGVAGDGGRAVPTTRPVVTVANDDPHPRPVAVPPRRIPTTVRDIGPARLSPRNPERRDGRGAPASTAPVPPGRPRALGVPAPPPRRDASLVVPAADGGCAVCGRLPTAGRRFCDCGTRLGPVERPRPRGRPAPAPSRPAGRKAFHRAARTAGGRRLRFDRRVAGRTVASRVLGVALVLGLAAALVLEPGAWLRREGGKLVLGPLTPLAVASAVTVPPLPAAEKDSAPQAVDGQDTRGWSAPWPQQAVGAALPPECAAPDATALVVTFDAPANVDGVRIYTGLSRETAAWSKQDVPQIVDVEFSDGTCERLTLSTTTVPQELTLDADSVTSARLTVVRAAPPVTGAGGTVSLAEVTFLHR